MGGSLNCAMGAAGTVCFATDPVAGSGSQVVPGASYSQGSQVPAEHQNLPKAQPQLMAQKPTLVTLVPRTFQWIYNMDLMIYHAENHAVQFRDFDQISTMC